MNNVYEWLSTNVLSKITYNNIHLISPSNATVRRKLGRVITIPNSITTQIFLKDNFISIRA